MNESQFRKLVREELQKVITEIDFPEKQTKESIISQIYQWIIRGDMKKAVAAMQNDPELMRLAQNVDNLKKELVRRMSQDKGMERLFADAIEKLKREKGIK